MEIGLVLALIPLLVVLYTIYELVLRKQWWFYHVSVAMRNIREKLTPWNK